MLLLAANSRTADFPKTEMWMIAAGGVVHALW
jgi:hypothetical protein